MNLRWSVLALVCLLLPALAQAANDAPAAVQSPPPSMLPTGAPMQPPAPVPAPRLPPPAQTAAPEQGTGEAPLPPEYDADTGRIAFDFAGLRLTQSRSDDAYLLDIDLRGLPPEQVQIRPAGGGLLLAVRRIAETSREETLEGGRGYRRSWGFATGQRVKRLPAPPDADVRNLQRTDADGSIQVRIPRRADLPGYGPPTPATAPQEPQQ